MDLEHFFEFFHFRKFPAVRYYIITNQKYLTTFQTTNSFKCVCIFITEVLHLVIHVQLLQPSFQ